MDINENSKLEDFKECENQDGIRLSWNVFPATYLGAKKLIIPLGCLYTPLIRAEEIERVPYSPIKCLNSSCGAFLNSYCDNDLFQKMWVCTMCQSRNPFPPNYARTFTQQNLPHELQSYYTTIEYQPEQDPMFPPAFVFVIDTAIIEEELNALCETIKELCLNIPEHIAQQALIGIITFGKHVALHEIGFHAFTKIHVFRGDTNDKDENKHLTIDQIKEQLNISQESVEKFLVPINTCHSFLQNLLSNLGKDTWPQKPNHRAPRCTGAAIIVAISLMEACCQTQSARILIFSGGAPNCGPGQIVDSFLENHIRSHQDIIKGNANYYQTACNFYKTIAARAVENGHVIDLFACCLDQVGVAEQRSLVDITGGFLILNDTFTTNSFSESLIRTFNINIHEELSMCFNSEITVVTSNDIKINGCVGPVTSMGQKSNNVALKTIGIGGTNKWSMGGLDPKTTLCFYFEVVNSDNTVMKGKCGYVQYITTYRDSNGFNISRTTTFSFEFAYVETQKGLQDVKLGFDEEAGISILARKGTFKAENEYDYNIVNWLDKSLIKLCSKVGEYVPDQPQSFALPNEFFYFPQFVFYLRRSQFVRIFGCSPDETAYYRHWLCRSNVTNSLTMIQPTLIRYQLNCIPISTLLDVSSRQHDVILLLDTFFHVVKWTGSDVAAWRDENLREDPEWSHVGEFLDKAEIDMVNRCTTRFPYPTEIRCDAGGSQARFLNARLNPSVKANQIYDGPPPIWTDDVCLNLFIDHLKRLCTKSFT